MALLFITHPEVVIDPAVPVARWGLNEKGRSRMAAFAASPVVAKVAAVYASGETKAQEGAAILAGARELPVVTDPLLGENDRTATGFLPPPEFEQVADAFFANPTQSVRGWERAVDAQARVVAAVERALGAAPPEGDVAIVAHGAVGTLAFCHYSGIPIGRRHDQPGQGHYWAMDGRTVLHGWREIAPR